MRLGGFLTVGLLLSGCTGILQIIATQHIWARWSTIHTLDAETTVHLPIYSSEAKMRIRYEKPERFLIQMQAPSALAGSFLSFDRGTFKAFNAKSKTGLWVEGVPLLRDEEKKQLIRSFLGQRAGRTQTQFVGRESVAGIWAEKYRITLMQDANPWTQWVWIDRPKLVPLKALYNHPVSGETFGFEVRTIAYNQEMPPGIFLPEFPKSTPVIHFRLEPDVRVEPVRLASSETGAFKRDVVPVRDLEGSDWAFADVSLRPLIFYDLYSASCTPNLPLLGFMQTVETQGLKFEQLVVPGYSVIYFNEPKACRLFVTNLPFNQAVEAVKSRMQAQTPK
jgi:hypothetical protein